MRGSDSSSKDCWSPTHGPAFFDLISYESGSSRIATVQYYSGYLIQYVYDSGTGYPDAGYLRQIVAPNNNNQVLWQADARDQELHLIESEAGGGLVQETQVFDTDTGRLTHTCASNDSQLPNCDGNVANFQYDWDSAGRLSDRIDYLAGTGGLTEFFCYDNLNRLTDVGGYGPTNTCTNGSHTNVGYDAIGNIADKTDAGIYTAAPSGPNSLLPHAVASIAVCTGCKVDGISGGNTINFYYDQNGNLNCETTATSCDASAINGLSWTSFNQPSSITHEGGTNIAYSYDPEHNRIEMNAPGALTKYLSDPAAGVLTEHMGPTVSPYIDRDYITADGKTVAIIVTQNSSLTNVYYPVLDHLGSVSVIVDGNRILANGNANPNYGKAIDRYSYDAWGEARDPAQWTPRNCADGPQPPFTRGFTGQEHIPNGVCLINFNARIYNPAIGRFFSADPTVEAPYNPQDLNRYSYVLDDPLGFTDPSGLCFLGCFWDNTIFRDFAAAILVAVFQQWEVLPEIGLELGFVTTSASVAAVVNAGILGGMSGAIISGNLKGAALGALQAGMFAEAGNLVQGIPQTDIVARAASTLVTHGLVGGVVSVSGGGRFGSGFIAAGFASQFEPGPAQNWEQAAWGATEAAVAGGFGSVLGGGKFENGAITGAFGYLFNGCMHTNCYGQTGTSSTLGNAWASFYNYFLAEPINDIGELLNNPSEIPGAVSDTLVGVAPVLGEAASLANGAAAAEEGLGAAQSEYSLTQTVEGNLASRPYVNSPLTVQQIEATGQGVPDPGGIPGALRYDVPGTFNGYSGTYQLVIDPQTNTVYHFLFTSGK